LLHEPRSLSQPVADHLTAGIQQMLSDQACHRPAFQHHRITLQAAAGDSDRIGAAIVVGVAVANRKPAPACAASTQAPRSAALSLPFPPSSTSAPSPPNAVSLPLPAVDDIGRGRRPPSPVTVAAIVLPLLTTDSIPRFVISVSGRLFGFVPVYSSTVPCTFTRSPTCTCALPLEENTKTASDVASMPSPYAS
jgi:hypothetical protein